LMESGVDFVAADMPHANKLTVHILAAVAEHERDMIPRAQRPRWLLRRPVVSDSAIRPTWERHRRSRAWCAPAARRSSLKTRCR
jgi:hypothetical protein